MFLISMEFSGSRDDYSEYNLKLCFTESQAIVFQQSITKIDYFYFRTKNNLFEYIFKKQFMIVLVIIKKINFYCIHELYLLVLEKFIAVKNKKYIIAFT